MKQSYTHITFSIAALLLIVACEGPVGPMGPRGERGLRGESGISAFVLIEEYLNDDAWNEEFTSYYVRDYRIQPTTVAGVYVKKFYTNTGAAYYLSLLDWHLTEDPNDSAIVHVSSGRVRFYDPEQVLRNEVVAVAITLP